MTLIPISKTDFSLMPIEGGIDYEPITPDWANVLPPAKIEPSVLASINDIAGQIGTIFDKGYTIYERIAGRATANKQIAGETIQPDKTPIILQQTKGFYELYNENKMSVFLIGGGLVLLTMTLLIKKIR